MGLLRELQEWGLDFSRTQRVKIIQAIRACLLYIYMRMDQWVVVKLSTMLTNRLYSNYTIYIIWCHIATL